MPNQDTHGRFTPSAWNIIKSIKLTEEEQEKLRLMIESMTETITLDEIKVMISVVVRG